MKRSWAAPLGTIVAIILTLAVVGVLPAAALPGDPAGVITISPCVVLDTDAGSGAFSGPVTPGSGLGIDFQVTGILPGAQGGSTNCGIPASATGVLVNVATVNVTAFGNLRVFPAGGAVSGGVVNYGLAALENSNAIIVPLSVTGALTVESNPNAVDVIATAIGYLEPNGGLPYTPVEPCAVSDTRPAGNPSNGFEGPFVGNETRTIDVAGVISVDQGGGNPNCGVPELADAVLVNLVALGATGQGSLGARQAGAASNAGYVSYNQLTPPMNNSNAVILALSASGELDLYTQASASVSVHVRVVVIGYLDSIYGTDSYYPVAPCAAFDSRPGQSPGPGYSDFYDGSEARTMQITGVFPADQGGGNTDCLVPSGATAVLVNVVALLAQRNGNLRAYATGATGSGGIVNFNAVGMNNSNAVVVPLSADGKLDIYANAGTTGVGLDAVQVRGVVLGYFADPTPQLEFQITGPESYTPPLNQPTSVPITITGTIADPLGAGNVNMAIQDLGLGVWLWPGTGGSLYWDSQSFYFFSIAPTSPGATSSSWSFQTFDPDAIGGSGNYRVYANYRDANFNQVIDTFQVRTVAPTPPTGTLEAPLDGATVPHLVTLRGSTDDEQGITSGLVVVKDVNSAEYLYQSTPLSLGWTPASSAIPINVFDQAWSVALDGPSMTGRTLEVVELSLTDGGGTSATIAIGSQFTIGTSLTFPVIEIDVPGPTGLVPTPFTLQGVASDGSGIVDVDLQLRDTVNNLYFTGTAWSGNPNWIPADVQTAGFGNVAWSYTGVDHPLWGSGEWEVRARARDAAGTETTHAWVPFLSIYDTAPPVVTLTTPVASSINSAPVSITGTATDNTGLTTAAAQVLDNGSGLYWNGSDWVSTAVTVPLPLATPLSGSTSFSGTLFDPPFGDKAGTGDYTLVLSVTDLAGLVGSETVDFVVDETDPTVTILTPTPDQLFNDPPAIFAGTVTDDQALGSTVEVQIKDLVSGNYWDGTAFVAGQLSFSAPLASPGALTSTWTASATLVGGQNFYQVTVFHDDSVGNTGQTSLVNFDVDHAAPVISIATPSPGQTMTSGTNSFNGHATDDVEVVMVEIRILDTNSGLYYAPTGYTATQTWLDAGPTTGASGLWNAGAIDIDAFGGSGDYQIQARATDIAGKTTNTGNVTFSTVDNIDPVAVPTSPADDAFSLTATPTLLGSATDNFEVLSVEIELREIGVQCGSNDYFNGSTFVNSATTFDAPVTSGAGTNSVGWTVTPDLASGCGDYTWKARAKDPAGNIGPWTASRTFHVDTAPPVVTFTTPNDAALLDNGTIVGTRNDDRGANGVDVFVTILDSAGSDYWNGTAWVSGAVWLPATFVGATDWTYTMPAQSVLKRSGPFSIGLKGVDEADREGFASPITVHVLKTSRAITYDAPTLFANQPVSLFGTAVNIDGIDRVELAIRELAVPNGATTRYWTPGGWAASSPSMPVIATLVDSNPYESDWSYFFDPGPTGTGTYEIDYIRVIEDDGGTNTANADIELAVDAGPPTVTFDAGNSIGLVDATSEISGGKNDDQGGAGVTVEVSVLDFGTNEYWTGSGWSSTTVYLSTTSSSALVWSYDLPPLATLGRPGSFKVVARATDAIGKISSELAQVVVLPESLAATVTSPALHTSRPITLTGTADNVFGVSTVTLEIRERSATSQGGSATRWWTPTGWTTGGNSSPVSATIVPLNPYQATWSYTFNPGEVSTGLFEVTEIRVDGANALSGGSNEIDFFYSTSSPTVEVTNPVDGSAVSYGTGSFPFKGTLSSDSQPDNLLEYRIFSIGRGEYWTGGAWQTSPVEISSTITTTDRGSGNWTWDAGFINLPEPGEYELMARARDDYDLEFGTWGPWDTVASFKANP